MGGGEFKEKDVNDKVSLSLRDINLSFAVPKKVPSNKNC